MNQLRLLLLPFSGIYWLVTFIRNKLFDWKILKSVKFNLPVICVGNITVGGTGKTPHIEYLIDILSKGFRIGVLSRGYKRNTKGFVLATKKSTSFDIGDEPFQILNKYKNVNVAVCEKRVEGVKKLIKEKRKTEIILLDDAFQHRYIKPGLSILLIDYNRPVFNDFILPAGNLRESVSAIERAQIIVISKSPEELTEIEKMQFYNRLNLNSCQHLFFSTFEYGNPEPVFKSKSKYISLNQIRKEKAKVLLVTAIANPAPLTKHFDELEINYETIFFPDHHRFSKSDIKRIKKEYCNGENHLIITTEKDAARFKSIRKIPKVIKQNCLFLPVKVKFHDESANEFNRILLEYVIENKKIN